MNTIEMYARVRFHANRTRSGRFDRNTHLDVAINIAINDILNARIDPIKNPQSRVSFESARRVKSELGSLVTSELSLAFSNNYAEKPADLFYPLTIYATINGSRKWCEEMLFNSDGPHMSNNLSRPTKEYPKWTDEGGFRIRYGGGTAVLSKVELTYVRKPTIVGSGIALTSAATLVTGSQYGVVHGTVTYDGNNYAEDSFFTVGATTSFTGTGQVALLTNTDMPTLLHEEVCRRACIVMLGTVENFEKVTAKAVEDISA